MELIIAFWLGNMAINVHMLMIAKYFVRIGDHCANVAEWVEFPVTGVHKDCQ